MALELAPHRVQVNAIGPGVTETPMTRAMLEDPERRRYFEEHTPLGRPARPEEIAAVAVFLASPESSYMTGSIVFVDGGRLIL
jgi:NAD(P)-dependent dehydrogenase (short-subunit alcohol dehydrogenase family)